jgi:hypothetical protein
MREKAGGDPRVELKFCQQDTLDFIMIQLGRISCFGKLTNDHIIFGRVWRGEDKEVELGISFRFFLHCFSPMESEKEGAKGFFKCMRPKLDEEVQLAVVFNVFFCEHRTVIADHVYAMFKKNRIKFSMHEK